MFTLLLHIADYIRSRNVLKGKINDIPKLKDFGEATWNFFPLFMNLDGIQSILIKITIHLEIGYQTNLHPRFQKTTFHLAPTNPKTKQ